MKPLNLFPTLLTPNDMTFGTAQPHKTEQRHPVLVYFEENRDFINRQIRIANSKKTRRNFSYEDVMSDVFLRVAKRCPDPGAITPSVIRTELANYFWKASGEDNNWQMRTQLDTDLRSRTSNDHKARDSVTSFFDTFRPGGKRVTSTDEDEVQPQPARREEAALVSRLLQFLPMSQRLALEAKILHEEYDPDIPFKTFAAAGDARRYKRIWAALERAREQLTGLVAQVQENSTLADSLEPQSRQLETLNRREQQAWVLHRIGLKAREVADRLRLKPANVRCFITSARQKLGIPCISTERLKTFRQLYAKPPEGAGIGPEQWNKLTATQKAVFSLAHQQTPVETIARQLEIKPVSVEQVLVNARRRLGIISRNAVRLKELEARFSRPPEGLAGDMAQWQSLTSAQKAIVTLYHQHKSTQDIHRLTGYSPTHIEVAYREAKRILGIPNARTTLITALEKSYDTPPQGLEISQENWNLLTPTEKAAFTLSLQDKKPDEVASLTGMSPNSVYTALGRARKKLAVRPQSTAATARFSEQCRVRPDILPLTDGQWAALRDSERVIVTFLSQGLCRSEVAQKLGITEDTSSKMLESANVKMGTSFAFRRKNQSYEGFLKCNNLARP